MSLYYESGYADLYYIEDDNLVLSSSDNSLFLEALNSFRDMLLKFDTDLVNIGTRVNNIDYNQNSLNLRFSDINQSKFNEYIQNAILQNVGAVIADASLNGYGCEFKDNDLVTVAGRTDIYTVKRSFFSLFADNGYTVHYSLLSDTGKALIVPEALLKKVT